MNERRRRAVALRYGPDDRAPVVVAKGAGFRADRIIELAEAHGVAIREDRVLVEALSHLDERDPIPAELYAAVAELLALVYRLDERLGPPARHGIRDPEEP